MSGIARLLVSDSSDENVEGFLQRFSLFACAGTFTIACLVKQSSCQAINTMARTVSTQLAEAHLQRLDQCPNERRTAGDPNDRTRLIKSWKGALEHEQKELHRIVKGDLGATATQVKANCPKFWVLETPALGTKINNTRKKNQKRGRQGARQQVANKGGSTTLPFEIPTLVLLLLLLCFFSGRRTETRWAKGWWWNSSQDDIGQAACSE